MFSITRISILFYFLSALIAQPGTYALQFDDEFDYVNIGRPLTSESNDNITIVKLTNINGAILLFPKDFLNCFIIELNVLII